MTSNNEKSYIFINYKVFPVQQKRFESKISPDFEKRGFLAFSDFLAKNRHPTCFTKNQPENDAFSKSSFSELGRDFPLKKILLDQWICEVVENTIFGPAEDFYWTGGGFMLTRFFQLPLRWLENPTFQSHI